MRKVSFVLAAFAFVPAVSLAGEITLKSLEVKNPLTAGVPYEVRLPYTKTGNVKVKRGCFTWSGEGPYCFNVNVRNKTIRAQLRTGKSNVYNLGAHIEYTSDGKKRETNRVFASIDVRSKDAMQQVKPEITSTEADIKCAQQGLLDAGFNPKGVDGKIGKGARSAASKYLSAKGLDLPKFTQGGSARWCQHFRSLAEIPNSKIGAGIYRAVFSTFKYKGSKRVATNRCGMLTVDYGKGHFYRIGLCNDDKSDIVDNSSVWQTGVVSVADDEIEVLTAKYDLTEVAEDKLTGSWTLREQTNPVLVFLKIN